LSVWFIANEGFGSGVEVSLDICHQTVHGIPTGAIGDNRRASLRGKFEK
jgi:hypothetical protein